MTLPNEQLVADLNHLSGLIGLSKDTERLFYNVFKVTNMQLFLNMNKSYFLESMQCTTQRVYSKRDLFKTLTSMNIARDHRNRITHRFIEL